MRHWSFRYIECCRDCACCDISRMKCIPDSEDCEPEYDLTEEDLNTPKGCDFFKRRNSDEV